MIIAMIITIIGVLLDRITKLWALNSIKNESIVVIDNFFKFEYLENRGAAFGIMQNRQLLLTIFSIIFLTGIILYLYKNGKRNKLMIFAIGFISAGAIGNLIDRVYYKYVIDFICLHYKNAYYFPTFNIADICVCIGAFLMAVYISKGGINDEDTQG